MAGKNGKTYRETHKRLRFWITRDYAERLAKLLGQRGLNQSQWLSSKIDQDLAERLPESQGGVRRIIPLEFVRTAREILAREADVYVRLAENTASKMERARLFRRADVLQDYVSWLSETLEEYRFRQHILETGQKSPRQRKKSGPHPADARQAKTIEHPIG